MWFHKYTVEYFSISQDSANLQYGTQTQTNLQEYL